MKKLVASLLSQKRIAGGAAVLAGLQLLSSGCGFLRDQAFSIMYPLDSDPIGVASVYIAAFRPSDLLFQIFVMSCLSVVLVPFLASHLAHERREEMNKITASTMLVFGTVFGLIALVMAIFFPLLAPHMVKFEGPSLELYIRFGRMALLTNFLFVFGNTLGQYLITVQRYWVYGITPIVWALGTIAGTYLLSPILGPIGPMIGTIAGTILYLIVRSVGARKAGFRFSRLSENILHPELKHMGLLIIPRMAALGALQLQLLLLDRLASGLEPGMVALNQFASNFESLVPGIVGIAIAQSSFSLLSQSAARGEYEKMSGVIRQGILFNLAIAIPGAVVLSLLTGVAAMLLRIGDSVIPLFTASLLIYCIAIPFESTNHIILRSFYAMKNTQWPAISSVVSCTLAVATGTALIGEYGVFALAIAYVIAQVSQTIFLGSSLALVLRRKRRPVVS
ncbi:hypothetical protein EXS65_02825 [Candidatus Peribacteria bacterium]|nr:hypothetical protein [Candidatus Peribacteria bacterium]